MSRQYRTRTSVQKSSSAKEPSRFVPPAIAQPKAENSPEEQLPEWKPGGSGKSPLIRFQQALQAKLTVGEPHDKYEQEADRLARNVVEQINSLPSDAAPQRETVQRERIEGGDRLQTTPVLQRKAPTGAGDAPKELESDINRAKGGGRSLDAGLQASMGQAMGADFRSVRIHTDSHADRMNQSIQAKAFTTGQDVFFRRGAYQPHAKDGQELIAHELTHVIQQDANNTGYVQRTLIPEYLDEKTWDTSYGATAQGSIQSVMTSSLTYTVDTTASKSAQDVERFWDGLLIEAERRGGRAKDIVDTLQTCATDYRVLLGGIAITQSNDPHGYSTVYRPTYSVASPSQHLVIINVLTEAQPRGASPELGALHELGHLYQREVTDNPPSGNIQDDFDQAKTNTSTNPHFKRAIHLITELTNLAYNEHPISEEMGPQSASTPSSRNVVRESYAANYSLDGKRVSIATKQRRILKAIIDVYRQQRGAISNFYNDVRNDFTTQPPIIKRVPGLTTSEVREFCDELEAATPPQRDQLIAYIEAQARAWDSYEQKRSGGIQP